MTNPASPPLTRRRWVAFSLRTLAIAVAFSALAVARYADWIREWWSPRSHLYTIRTRQDFHTAVQSKRAAIFCDVRVSINAAHSGRIFGDFVRHWQQDSAPPVDFYLLDLTDRNSEATQAAVEYGLNRTTGMGEVLWILDARPREYTRGLEGRSIADVTDIARRALAISTAAGPQNPSVKAP